MLVQVGQLVFAFIKYSREKSDSSTFKIPLKDLTLSNPPSPQSTHTSRWFSPTVDVRGSLPVPFLQVHVVPRGAACLLLGSDCFPGNKDAVCAWCHMHLGPS